MPSIQIELIPPKPPREVISNRFGLVMHMHAHLDMTFKLCLLFAYARIPIDGTLDGRRELIRAHLGMVQETRLQASKLPIVLALDIVILTGQCFP